VFHNRGNVAVIGRHAAVIDFGRFRLKGIIAWLLWALIHIYLLAGLQHRLLVAVQWFWRYLTYDRGARMIIEPSAEGREPSC
jgi:NADH dehydrogenase